MSTEITTQLEDFSSRLSKWQNAFNAKTKEPKQSQPKIVRRKHTMAALFEKPNKITQAPSTRSGPNVVSLLTADRLKQFYDSGEKYFKIVIEQLPVYEDKLLRFHKQQAPLYKDAIVPGTYVNLKVFRLAHPYNAYCASHHVKPTDLTHATYVRQSQKFNGMLTDIQQQLDDIQNKQKELEELKQSEPKPVFVSEDTFAQNIINCTKVNGAELSDKFIHIEIDDSDPQQLQDAATVAATRAFESRFVSPIVDIVKGKAFGEMSILLPSGLTHKYTFNGQRNVYRGTATFKVSDIGSQTFTCCVYYEQSHFNPIRRANNVDSSNVYFVEERNHRRCSIDSDASFNELCQDAAKKLQQKYLSKMDERNKTNKVYHSDTIPGSDIFQITSTGPKEACRAYFTGLLLGGTYEYGCISVPYQIDDASECVNFGQGEYPRNSEAFPKAVAATFDGIAIDRNTRVIIYEKENFQGNILLDARGPKIVNNGIYKNLAPYKNCNTETFPDAELQRKFPAEARMWTETNMRQWSYGSAKILSTCS